MIIFGINDYINLKSAYKIAERQIEILEHRREQVDLQMVKVEKDTNDNFIRRQKSFLEIQRTGYLNSNDGNNPKWMRTYSYSNH